MNVAQHSISILVPAYNEEGNLADAVRSAIRAAARFDDAEIIIVNDGSTDGTGQVAESMRREHPGVRVIHHDRNKGFAQAYRTALEQARMPYFTFVPGDGEVAEESLLEIFDAVGSADIVIPYHGTPKERPRYRRLLTRVSTTEVNLLFGWNVPYYQGPTVYPTKLVKDLPLSVDGFYFATELLVHALVRGCSWVPVGLRHCERRYGSSKAVSFRNMVRAQRVILRLWWDIRVRKRNGKPTPALTSSESVSS